MTVRKIRPKKCAECKHHVSMHGYTPNEDGIGTPPLACSVSGCSCKRYKRPRTRQ